MLSLREQMKKTEESKWDEDMADQRGEWRVFSSTTSHIMCIQIAELGEVWLSIKLDSAETSNHLKILINLDFLLLFSTNVLYSFGEKLIVHEK